MGRGRPPRLPGFSLARWHRVGVLFHPLFQFVLMGVDGAFLTGDLFNLFVFFEVLLAASYGLALHRAGLARVTAGMHYIVVNLAASQSQTSSICHNRRLKVKACVSAGGEARSSAVA